MTEGSIPPPQAVPLPFSKGSLEEIRRGGGLPHPAVRCRFCAFARANRYRECYPRAGGASPSPTVIGEHFRIPVCLYRIAGSRAADSRPYGAQVHFLSVGVDPLIDPKCHRIGEVRITGKRPSPTRSKLSFAKEAGMADPRDGA